MSPEKYIELQAEVAQLQQEGRKQPYLLYAMGLRLGTLDYESLETDALLDGSDDKKVDFFYIDHDAETAVIAQGYYSDNWEKRDVSSNKAAELGTALNWLLESDLDSIARPDIRAAATELRDLLNSGEVTRLEVYFVHNLESSAQVDGEFDTLSRSVTRQLARYNSGSIAAEPRFIQASRNVVDDWRQTQNQAIAIRDVVTLDSITVPVPLSTADWQSVLLTVKAEQIVQLRKRYGDLLSSANIRDYLGSRQSTRNINKQIEKTAETEPENFWIFNNGVTVLTNSIKVDENQVELTGISIINGAQTTGSLVDAYDASPSVGEATVLMRVVRCANPALVERVIRFNNTQNPIKAWELRVIDPIQQRLSVEFGKIGINYQTRRGVSRRRATDVHYEKLGSYLAAFNGEPGTAHRNRAELFENEARYRKLFDDETSVKNLLFVYRLGEAIQEAKTRLKAKVDESTATDDEKAIYDYFRYGAFSLVVLYVCAEVIGRWLGGKDPRYRRKVTLANEILLDQRKTLDLLGKLVDAVLVTVRQHLSKPGQNAYTVIRSQAGVEELASVVKTFIGLVEQMHPDNYAEVRDSLVLVRNT